MEEGEWNKHWLATKGNVKIHLETQKIASFFSLTKSFYAVRARLHSKHVAPSDVV